ENGQVAWRNLGNMGQYRFQGGRCSYDLFEHRSFIDFFTQSDVFVTKSVFRLLAILNVSAGYIPSDDLPFVVAHRVVPNEKPTITSISFAQPTLKLVLSANNRSAVKQREHQ